MALKLITPPTTEPVTLDEAKAHCRIEADIMDEDGLVSALITAARQQAEAETRRQLVTATWELALDAFPDWIEIPLPPLQSVTSVKYMDSLGVEQTLSASKYVVDTHREPGRITLAYGQSWPTTYGQANDVKVRFIAGYGAASAVPEGIKAWIKLRLASLYEQRESMAQGNVVELSRSFVDGLLDPFRVYTF